jgi:hypothetical protein
MRLRTLGSGGYNCRHPLATASWLLQTDESMIVIGIPHQLPSRLGMLGVTLDQIDMFVPLSPRGDQIGGLEEVARHFLGKEKKPFLVAPERLMVKIKERLEPAFLLYLQTMFITKTVTKITVREEHFTEVLSFIPNYLNVAIPSFALKLEESKVFISGETELNETWLFKEMGCDLILHSCVTDRTPPGHPSAPSLEELSALPVYLQNKIWLYGYSNNYTDLAEPLPMLFLPQGVTVLDTSRRDKILMKERYIRENSRRILGNIDQKARTSGEALGQS